MLKAKTKLGAIEVPVLLYCARTFGGKRDPLGCVIHAFVGAETVENYGAPTFDFNGPAAEWKAGKQNEVPCYEALKAAINGDSGFTARGYVLTVALNVQLEVAQEQITALQKQVEAAAKPAQEKQHAQS